MFLAEKSDERCLVETHLARVGADDTFQVDTVRKRVEIPALERRDLVRLNLGTVGDLVGRQASAFPCLSELQSDWHTQPLAECLPESRVWVSWILFCFLYGPRR